MTSNNLETTIAKLIQRKDSRDTKGRELREQNVNAEAHAVQIEKLAQSEWEQAWSTVEDAIEHANTTLEGAGIKIASGKSDKPRRKGELGEWMMWFTIESEVETHKFKAVFIPQFDGKTVVWLTEEGIDSARHRWEWTTQEVSDDNAEEVIDLLLRYATDLD